MAFGDKYATLTELKARLGIGDTNDDPRLTNALSTASRGIEGLCGRQFNDGVTISARRYRPDSAYVVAVDDFSTTDGLTMQVNGAIWDTSRYELDPLNGVVDGEPGWPYWRIHGVAGNSFFPTWPGKANVVITARWGWASIPDPIHDACLVAAEELFKLRDMPFGVGGYGSYGVIKVRNNPFVQRMCQRYVRYPILAA